jgi:hypothetical protein
MLRPRRQEPPPAREAAAAVGDILGVLCVAALGGADQCGYLGASRLLATVSVDRVATARRTNWGRSCCWKSAISVMARRTFR